MGEQPVGGDVMCLGSPLEGLGSPLEKEGMTGSLAASTSIRGIALMVGGDPPLHVGFVAVPQDLPAPAGLSAPRGLSVPGGLSAPGRLLAPGELPASGEDTFCPWGLFISLLGLPVCSVTCFCIISASVFSSALAD